MGLKEDIALINIKINSAIADALRSTVADVAKDEISRQLSSYEFPYSRGDGGLLDKENLTANVESHGNEHILEITDDALFQGMQVDYTTLAEVVTQGNEAFRMPGPRPFFQPAEQHLIKSGTVEAIIGRELRARGFDTTGISISEG